MNLIVVNNLLIIFAMIAVGFFTGRAHILSEKASGDFTSLLMKVTLPCTIFSSMIREFDQSLIQDSVIIFVLGLIIFGGLNLLNQKTAVLFRVTPSRRSVWVVASSMCNTGFMGFPLVLAVFGSEGLFLAAIMNVAYNIIAFTLCTIIIARGSDSAGEFTLDWKKILLTNANYAVVLGLFFFVTQIPVHNSIMRVVDSFGNITTPLSMFLIGLSLSDGKLTEIFRDRDVLSCSFVRLLIVPVAIALIMRIIPFPEESLLPGVVTLIMAMPGPSISLILAQEYGGDTLLASRAIFLTSLCCIVTIPLIMMLV